jgi:WD40 repeat protein
LRFNSEDGSGIQKVATVSKDNSLIATGGEAGVLKIWRLKPKPSFTHELVSTGLGHKGDITAISIPPSNIVVCTCCVDKVCRIFQVRTGIKLYTLQFSDKAGFVPLVFKGCAFSTRGDILYTLGTNPRGQAYITKWNASGRYHPIDSYSVHKNPACSIKLSSSGKRMTIACNDGLMKVLDTTDMKIKYSKELFEMPVTGVDFFSDEDKLVVGSADYGYEFVIMKDMGYTKYLLILFALILLYCLYPLHLIDY